MVTRYEKGLAYVRPWEEMAGEHEAVAAGSRQSSGCGAELEFDV